MQKGKIQLCIERNIIKPFQLKKNVIEQLKNNLNFKINIS